MGELLKDWQARVGEWVDAKLRPVAPADLDILRAFLRKNFEESAELRHSIDANEDDVAVEDEAADEFITIIAILHQKGLSLESGLQRKLPILESGDWYYNTELGVFKRRK